MDKNLINFLISLKNHSLLKKEVLINKFSNNIIKVVEVLYSEGLIQSYSILSSTLNQKYVRIHLRYYFNKPIINFLKIIAKKSFSKSVTFKDLFKISDKRFVLFILTVKGIQTISQCKKNKIGGKILFIC